MQAFSAWVPPTGTLGRIVDEARTRARALEQRVAELEELAKRAFVHLENVNDDWIEKIQIAQLPGGRLPDDQEMRLAAELGTTGTPERLATCCAPASRVAPRPGPTTDSMVANAP